MTPQELYRLARRFHVRARRTLAGSLAGLARSVFRGRGLSFEEVRPYQPGDEVRDIDWKVTARMGRPFLKKFAEEREQTLWLLLDESGSMQFGSEPLTKQEYSRQIVALLALAASANADRVGLVTFGRRLWVAPPRRGSRQAFRLIRDLLADDGTFPEPLARKSPCDMDAQSLTTGLRLPSASAPEARHIGTGIDPATAVDTLRRLARTRAMIFVISDLLFDRPWAVLARLHRRHEVTVLRIVDPAEENLPNWGLVRWRDAETGAIRLIDTSSQRIRDAYAAQARRRQRELRDQFARFDIACHTLSTNRPAGLALFEKLG